MFNRTLPILFVLLLAASSAGLTSPANATNVESRVQTAIGFIEGQNVTRSGVVGFVHGVNGPSETQRAYSLDNGLVALALASYQQTHNTEEFYQDLKNALQFLRQAQTNTGDFYEYYDLANNTWVLSGQLYYWDAYALMGASYGPGEYAAINEYPSEQAYWTGIVNMLRTCVDYWIPKAQQTNGAILFSFPGESPRTDVAANGAVLSALVHIALFEYFWGDPSLAAKYAQWSQPIANWLGSMQETNMSSWGAGGFYTNTTRTFQSTFENGIAMLGLNAYYKAMGVFQSSLSGEGPSTSALREMMINWTQDFVEETLDSWNGPQYGRAATGVVHYPKETIDGASLLQALVDVWINIGSQVEMCSTPDCYWAEAVRVYNWFAGSNELSLDLEQGKDLAGRSGGFYDGIGSTGAIVDSSLATTALTLFSMVRASYIEVPEFTHATTSTSSSSPTFTSTLNSTSAVSFEKLPSWLTVVAAAGLGILICVAIFVKHKASRRRKHSRTVRKIRRQVKK